MHIVLNSKDVSLAGCRQRWTSATPVTVTTFIQVVCEKINRWAEKWYRERDDDMCSFSRHKNVNLKVFIIILGIQRKQRQSKVRMWMAA